MFKNPVPLSKALYCQSLWLQQAVNRHTGDRIYMYMNKQSLNSLLGYVSFSHIIIPSRNCSRKCVTVLLRQTASSEKFIYLLYIYIYMDGCFNKQTLTF
jgi:hypothetical protein